MAGGPEQERVIGHQRRRKKQRRGARPQRCRTAICILPRQTKKSSAGISPTAVSLVKNASPQAITAAYHHPTTPPPFFPPFFGGVVGVGRGGGKKIPKKPKKQNKT